jgi:ERCC4-type nuclease
MALIIADSREQNGAIPYLEACVAENNRTNQRLSLKAGGGDIQYAEKQLTVGDYCILIPSQRYPCKNILAVVFERKTWKDLAASIKDSRMKEQQKGLDSIKLKKDCQVYFIIEGPLKYVDTHKIGNIPFKNLGAKLRHNLLRGFPYVQTKDPQDTAHTIVNFARDVMKLYAIKELVFFDDMLEKDKELILEYRKKIDEINKGSGVTTQQENILITENNDINISQKIEESLDDISTINDIPSGVDIETLLNLHLIKGGLDEVDIPSEIKTRRIRKDSDIIECMWESIPGISNKTAPILMNKYSLSEIICANANRLANLRMEIAELKYPSGIKIGDKKALKILEISYAGENISRQEKARTASIKLLACIPNVTPVTAELVINNFTLRDICNGEISSDDVANLKKPGGRRIGEKCAEKIICILQTIYQNQD